MNLPAGPEQLAAGPGAWPRAACPKSHQPRAVPSHVAGGDSVAGQRVGGTWKDILYGIELDIY